MRILKRSNRMGQKRANGFWQIRVYHRGARVNKGPRYLLKCGCCNESLEIFYDNDSLEINGVHGSIQDWREILLPLLKISKR